MLDIESVYTSDKIVEISTVCNIFKLVEIFCIWTIFKMLDIGSVCTKIKLSHFESFFLISIYCEKNFFIGQNFL